MTHKVSHLIPTFLQIITGSVEFVVNLNSSMTFASLILHCCVADSPLASEATSWEASMQELCH